MQGVDRVLLPLGLEILCLPPLASSASSGCHMGLDCSRLLQPTSNFTGLCAPLWMYLVAGFGGTPG